MSPLRGFQPDAYKKAQASYHQQILQKMYANSSGDHQLDKPPFAHPPSLPISADTASYTSPTVIIPENELGIYNMSSASTINMSSLSPSTERTMSAFSGSYYGTLSGSYDDDLYSSERMDLYSGAKATHSPYIGDTANNALYAIPFQTNAFFNDASQTHKGLREHPPTAVYQSSGYGDNRITSAGDQYVNSPFTDWTSQQTMGMHSSHVANIKSVKTEPFDHYTETHHSPLVSLASHRPPNAYRSSNEGKRPAILPAYPSSPSNSNSSDLELETEELFEISDDLRDAGLASGLERTQNVSSSLEDRHGRRDKDVSSREIGFSQLTGKVMRGERRKQQNRLAQRAFRARTKIHRAEISEQMTQLRDLTGSQARRMEKMKLTIEALQRENTGLKTAKWAQSLGDVQAHAIAAAENARFQTKETGPIIK